MQELMSTICSRCSKIIRMAENFPTPFLADYGLSMGYRCESCVEPTITESKIELHEQEIREPGRALELWNDFQEIYKKYFSGEKPADVAAIIRGMYDKHDRMLRCRAEAVRCLAEIDAGLLKQRFLKSWTPEEDEKTRDFIRKAWLGHQGGDDLLTEAAPLKAV